MFPINESGMRKLSAENVDRCWAKLLWDDPGTLREFKLIMNLFISTGGCILEGEPVLLNTA